MEPFQGGRLCARLVTFGASLLVLAACSSGGGAGGTLSSGGTGGSATPAVPAVPTVTIGPINPAAANSFLPATGTNSFPTGITFGTVFPVTISVALVTGTSVTNYPSQPATLTMVGIQTANGLVTSGSATGTFAYRITIPGLPLGTDANAILPRDGRTVTLAGGGTAWLSLTDLNYTTAGSWLYQPSSSLYYYSRVVTGFQTPGANVPTSGTATYLGDQTPANGRAVGAVFVPDGTGALLAGNLAGNANVAINFSTGGVSGTLSNMTVTPTAGGSAVPWNNVTLSGTLSGASINGSTAGSVAPPGAGSFGMSASASGTLTGALYGPNGQELGAVWTLNEPNPVNGKSAIGTITATKQ